VKGFIPVGRTASSEEHLSDPFYNGLMKKQQRPEKGKNFRMFLIPCSCGASFAVSDDYDRKGMHLRSFIPCPNCGKRHDPRNRLVRLDYQEEQFWKVSGC
jgi:hypothetical protein